MEKLADFILVEQIFREDGITPNWLYALSHGDTNIYNEKEILNYYVKDEIMVINSGSIDNRNFSMKLIKDMINLAKSYNKVIISSSVKEIESYMQKHGFKYNSNIKSYIKGIKWE